MRMRAYLWGLVLFGGVLLLARLATAGSVPNSAELGWVRVQARADGVGRGLRGDGATEVREGKESLVVENDFFVVTFSKRHKGALAQIKNKLTGRTLQPVSRTGRELYLIEMSAQGGEQALVGSSSARASAVTYAQKSRLTTVTITNKGHGKAGIDVVATCTISDGSPLLRWRARIKNGTRGWLRRFHYPIVTCTPKLGESEKDDYVMKASCDGVLYQNPMRHFSGAQIVQTGYPGGMSAQLMSFQDAKGGLYYATHDSEGYTKLFSVQRGDLGMNLAATHAPAMDFGDDYSTPYDTVLGVVKGGWRHACDIYKDWATRQSWCAKKIVERTDIPEWVKQAPLFYVMSMRYPFKSGDVPSEVFRSSGTHRMCFGRPILSLLMNWERHGPWITPQYFPPFGGDRTFRRMTKALKTRGDESMVFLSGLRWTLERDQQEDRYNAYRDKANFAKKGRRSAIIGEDGKVRMGGSKDVDTGVFAEICSSTPLAKKMILSAVKKCQRLGLTAVQADQILGGGQYPCYSKKHGHPPGPGPHIYKSLYKIFSAVIREGQRRDPRFAFSIEEPGELYIPSVSFYHARDAVEVSWPREGPNVRGAPVFTYLYHEYAIGYGSSNGATVSSVDAEGGQIGDSEVRGYVLTQARNLICGKIPVAEGAWGVPIDAEAIHPDQRKAMKGIAAILKTRARDYLISGRMLHPLKLAVPQKTMRDGKRSMDFPTVLHSVFEAADGSGVGYVFINWTGKTREFTIPIPAPSGNANTCDLWRYGQGGNVQRPSLSAVRLPRSLGVKLGPGESVFFEARPGVRKETGK